jgi:RNA polymerase sigma-70 factor, ECF subfamily
VIFEVIHDLRMDRSSPPFRSAHDPRHWPAPPDLDVALRHAQTGDEHAFRTLYRDIHPRILRYLTAMVGTDAEDVASETWLHVARDLHTFTGDSDGFRGWVATLARHRAIDHLRRAQRRPQPAPVTVEDLEGWAAAQTAEESALESLSTEAAIKLIATLPRDQAEAVLLRVVVGLDAISAAKVLGKRPGAVRTAAYRGLRKISAGLAKPGGHTAQGRAWPWPTVVEAAVADGGEAE